VEATKFTEVGYVGRDVESIVRDLVSVSINMVRNEMREQYKDKAAQAAEDQLLDLLLPNSKKPKKGTGTSLRETRQKLKKQLSEGKLDKRMVRIETKSSNMPFIEVFSSSMEEIDLNLREVLNSMNMGKNRERNTTVEEARKLLIEEELDRLVDPDKLAIEGIQRVEEMGIIFLDEIDKIAGKGNSVGPDVSREGVQRDILPIIEGSTVNTRYGPVRTDHILFIAAGAFNMSKPSDLIPELQGRFPIRVELEALSKDDLMMILTKPKNALIKQYQALLQTEGIKLSFNKDSINEIASIATYVNSNTENIGARRLHTIMEILLEDISFNAPTMDKKTFSVTKKLVQDNLKNVVDDRDLSRYIL
jgi:ATP-dependent HslUV protease ATP-binding subunit HslU